MTIFHRFCTAFPLLLMALLLVSCGSSETEQPVIDQSAAATAPAVKVAILLPLSGQHATVGQSMLQAAQLAVFDVGYENFELMPQDTGGTAVGAAAAVTKAIDGGAQLILGPLFAEEVRAVKSVTAGKKINILAFSTDWTLAGDNAYIMGFLPFGQVERIADYAAQKGLKLAAVAASTDTYGATASGTFETEAKKRGMSITRALSDINGYDSVFIPAGGADLSNILLRVTNKSAQKLGTGLWDDPRVAGMPEMNGAWFAAPSPSARISFEQRYETTYGTKPVRIASMAYDAAALCITLAKTGISMGRGPDFDAASLTSPNGFSGVDGILRFNKSNLIERGMAILEIRNGQINEIDKAPNTFSR